MTRTRRSAKLLALLAGASLIVGACSDDSDDSSSTEAPAGSEAPADTAAPADTEAPGDTEAPADTEAPGDTDAPAAGGGGTLVWAHEQEPPDLHLDDPENGLSITSWIRQGMWEGLYGISSETTFIPELLAEEAVMADNGDGTFTGSFVLRDGLTWSDGEPLTADDVKYTYELYTVKDDAGEYIYLSTDLTGYDTITDFTVVSPTEFTITWSAFFAGYPALFSEIHPAHSFDADIKVAAAEENEALRQWTLADGTVIPSSGPLVFDSWNVGVNMNFVRNELYHGSTSPDVVNQGVPASVDGVQINFVTDTDAQVNALKAGEADFIFTQPQLQFEELATSDDFAVASTAGPVFEHWGLNLNDTHLKKAAVREALALAMDKAEVMEGLYTPLFGDLLPTEGLGSTYWMSNQPEYVDNQGNAGYGHGDAEGAAAVLEAAGYTLGDDGIYTHPEDGRLSLRVGTTGGNRLREIQEELLQAQLKDSGIEIVIENGEGGAYFGDQPFNEDALACAGSGGAEGNCDVWDIAQFAWVGGPWPGSQSSSYKTGGGNNIYGYANPDFDAASDACDATVDNAERGACYADLDKWVTTLEKDPEGGLFMIPLTQKPSFYAYSKNRLAQAAVSPDANSAGPLVNVVDYVLN